MYKSEFMNLKSNYRLLAYEWLHEINLRELGWGVRQNVGSVRQTAGETMVSIPHVEQTTRNLSIADISGYLMS